MYHVKSNNKEVGVVVISDEKDFKTTTKNLTRDTVGHFIMKIGSIYQENVPIINMHTHEQQYTKQNLTERKEQTYNNNSWRL